MENDVSLPFQVESLIKSLLDKNDNIHIRNNFRQRLDSIRDAIDKAIVKYDQEYNSNKFQARYSKTKRRS